MRSAGRFFALVCCLAAWASGAVAAPQAADSLSVPADTTGAEKRFSWAFIPVIIYAPETGVAVGASVLLLFRGATEGTRPSTVAPTFIYTQKQQIIAVVGYELNLREDRWRAAGSFGHLKFPDLFYGIGPDTPDSNEEDYTPLTTFFNTTAQRSLGWRIQGGLIYEFARSEIRDIEPGGILDSGTVPGSEGGNVSGLGPILTWDSRDNLFYASRGSFHTFSATFFDPALGSDFKFQRYVADLRTFFLLWRQNILALQAVFWSTQGNVPFQMMPKLGGAMLLRGYYEGRYRDRQAFILQAEWRRRLWWRFGAAAFVGVGNVAPSISAFSQDTIRPAVGCGIRYIIDPKEGISIRMDFGFIGGSVGPYITINEAF